LTPFQTNEAGNVDTDPSVSRTESASTIPAKIASGIANGIKRKVRDEFSGVFT
jgi:hypothetical protein